MDASRVRGTVDCSCTRTLVSLIQVNMKIRKASPCESESTVPPFPVRP
jgi:hypothetical protein